MKRAGFTMIELIFVIVILGILAAVALPRFVGVSEQAHNQKVEAFVGTLNRTVGPSMWAVSIASGDGGQIQAGGTNYCSAANLTTYIDSIPDELVSTNDCQFDANATTGGAFGVDFREGNATNSPTWRVATTGTGGTY